MRRRGLAAVSATTALVAALTLSGCAGGAVNSSSSTPQSSAGGSATPSPTDRFTTTTPGPIAPSESPTGTPIELSSERWDAIVKDLESRGVTGTPELVSAEAVRWRDGSLGCPVAGQTYTQALIDGARVFVQVGDETFDYRFGKSDAPRLCEL